jgi:hypothetical protein
MGVETNAILAINSTDRYTINGSVTYSDFIATWANNSTSLTRIGVTVPVVGAQIVTTTGISEGTVITAFNSLTNAITISQPTLAAQAAPALVFQQVNTNNNMQQPRPNFLNGAYYDLTPYANNFTITSPGALIYGYITKIIVAQIQLNYNIPTVISSLSINNAIGNDTFWIGNGATGDLYRITIPFGFYHPDELAAMLQIQIRAADPIWTNMDVDFFPREGFSFSDNTAPTPLEFYFPTPTEVLSSVPGLNPLIEQTILRCYRLLGITANNVNAESFQISFDYPIFAYTSYIDIYSDALTNYQKVKDTNTSTAKPKGLIARIYISGVGSPQTTGSTSGLGTAPFVMTADLNFPKVITWTRDVAVPNLDFQMLDMYGELVPGESLGCPTEWQMTLLCTESDT